MKQVLHILKDWTGQCGKIVIGVETLINVRIGWVWLEFQPYKIIAIDDFKSSLFDFGNFLITLMIIRGRFL
jgi:hypothetical protein